MTLVDGEIRVVPVQFESSSGSPWLRELYDYYAPVREEILACGISEEEVNADIDAAVAAVRAKQLLKKTQGHIPLAQRLSEPTDDL